MSKNNGYRKKLQESSDSYTVPAQQREKEKEKLEKDLDRAFAPLIKRDADIEARLKQLEADVMVIAKRLGLIRSFRDGQLVHEDEPATKADVDALIEELEEREKKHE